MWGCGWHGVRELVQHIIILRLWFLNWVVNRMARTWQKYKNPSPILQWAWASVFVTRLWPYCLKKLTLPDSPQRFEQFLFSPECLSKYLIPSIGARQSIMNHGLLYLLFIAHITCIIAFLASVFSTGWYTLWRLVTDAWDGVWHTVNISIL